MAMQPEGKCNLMEISGQTLKIKKLHDYAIVPTKAYNGDAGYDLYAVEPLYLKPGETGGVSTGIAMELPEGYHAFIWGRSSMGKKGFDVYGGVIDNSYRGELIVQLHSSRSDYTQINKGDKVAQLIIQKVPHFPIDVVNQLSDSDRGEKGFGSSGK
jgi:deoxyuridine 5'-triphosphate nucleotidohydrolase